MKIYTGFILMLVIICSCKFTAAKPKTVPIPPDYYEPSNRSYLDSSFQYYYDIDLIKPQGISKVDTNQWRSLMLNKTGLSMAYTGTFWGVRQLGDSVILLCCVNASSAYKSKQFVFYVSSKKEYRRYDNIWLCQNLDPGRENYCYSSRLGKSFISLSYSSKLGMYELVKEYYVKYMTNTYSIYQFDGTNRRMNYKVNDTLGIEQAHLERDNLSLTSTPKWIIDFSKGADTILYYVENNVLKQRKFTWRSNDKLIHYFNGIIDESGILRLREINGITR